MKPEEKELLAMHKEIEDELDENKYISRKIVGVKEDSLIIRLPKRKMEEEKAPKKRVLKKKKSDPVPVKKKKGPLKKKNKDSVPMKKKKKPMKKKKKKPPNPEKEEVEPMDVEEETPIYKESEPDEDLLVELFMGEGEEEGEDLGDDQIDDEEEGDEDNDPWNDLEVPWKKLSYQVSEDRYKDDFEAIQDLSLEQRMTHYMELVVLGKGGRKIDTTAKNRAIVDFFSIERAKSGIMLGTYADKKRGETLAMCDYIGTLSSKILEFETKANGAQADCYFSKEKLKKADAWVCITTMEITDDAGGKTSSTSKKYVHKRLVPLLQAILFIIGFDVTIAGQIEELVGELDSSLTLDEKAKIIGESEMSKEFIKGLKYSMKKVAEATEWMDGFIDECWKS